MPETGRDYETPCAGQVSTGDHTAGIGGASHLEWHHGAQRPFGRLELHS